MVLSDPPPRLVGTPGLLSITLVRLSRYLPRLWWRPRWHPKPQHLLQGPDMVSQPGGHGRRTGLPASR
jgi:hypothetical protein